MRADLKIFKAVILLLEDGLKLVDLDIGGIDQGSGEHILLFLPQVSQFSTFVANKSKHMY